jgi:hypothetical protein
MVLLPLSVASPKDVDQGMTGHWPVHLYDIFQRLLRSPSVALMLHY